MIFRSVCSGIEAASVAWSPLCWKADAFAEIEPFPSAVLAHHYPEVPNLGDITRFREWSDAAFDVLVGGTPCQSFSVAGLRKGLADPRGNLALVYLGILDRFRPTWMVWENVPGVLSSNGGRDFGAFLGGLGQLGYGFAYRVLDAQFFGLAQRRKRVFVVGHLGDWRRAAAVLFERESLSGNPPPSRKSGQGFTYDAAPCLTSSGRGVERPGETRGQDPLVAVAFGGGNQSGHIDVATAQTAHGGRIDFESERFIAQGVALRGRDGGATAELTGDVMTALRTGGGGGDKPHVLLPIAFDETQITSAENRCNPQPGDACHPIPAHGRPPTLAFDARQSDVIQYGDLSGPLDTDAFTIGVSHNWRVRRLTPTECERLQGFPDGYTAIPYRNKPAADGPRYKALGNSMATNVMRWIGERIAAVESMRTAA